MSDELLKRLRERGECVDRFVPCEGVGDHNGFYEAEWVPDPVCQEAADEIARLTEAKRQAEERADAAERTRDAFKLSCEAAERAVQEQHEWIKVLRRRADGQCDGCGASLEDAYCPKCRDTVRVTAEDRARLTEAKRQAEERAERAERELVASEEVVVDRAKRVAERISQLEQRARLAEAQAARCVALADRWEAIAKDATADVDADLDVVKWNESYATGLRVSAQELRDALSLPS